MFMNEAECHYLLEALGASKLEDVRGRSNLQYLTLGSQGSDVYSQAGTLHVPAVSLMKLVDFNRCW